MNIDYGLIWIQDEDYFCYKYQVLTDFGPVQIDENYTAQTCDLTGELSVGWQCRVEC